MKRILVLGGTTEARQLAGKLAARNDVILSLAGRTEKPVAQGVPVRVGGFGGADGLAAYLKNHRIDLLVDATHPYAARMSANAAEASRLAGIPAIAIPCGFSKAGLPIGLQLISRPFAEDILLRGAHAYEQATEWRLKKPNLR